MKRLTLAMFAAGAIAACPNADTEGATEPPNACRMMLRSEEYRDALMVIRDGSEQLSRLVNDMFLLARADAGQAITIAPMYLDDLLVDTVRIMRSVANAKRVQINLASEESPFVGDEELLRRLFINLLDNAIKHAPADSSVDVVLHRDDVSYRIWVLDSGAGVPESERSHIFNRFYRADAVRTQEGSRHGSGAGLGLAIAREIAELHGGRLILAEPTAGMPSRTVFELTLPVNSGSLSERFASQLSPTQE